MSARDLSECPKCGLEAKTLLHRFCTYADCPVRAPQEPAPPPPSREAKLEEALRSMTLKHDTEHLRANRLEARVAELEEVLRELVTAWDDAQTDDIPQPLWGRLYAVVLAARAIVEPSND